MSKQLFVRYLYSVVLVALVSFASTSTARGAILFDVGPNGTNEQTDGSPAGSGNRFVYGTGYGNDGDGPGGSLLNVTFAVDANLGNIAFSLTAPGDTSTFTYGTITLGEMNIGADEVNLLRLEGILNFVLPDTLSATNVSVIGTINTGPVTDAAVDLTYSFGPVLVNFGNGGQFRVSLSSVSFSGQTTQTVYATVELVQAPEEDEVPSTATPEPASLAIWGLGAAGLVVAQRVRKRRSA